VPTNTLKLRFRALLIEGSTRKGKVSPQVTAMTYRALRGSPLAALRNLLTSSGVSVCVSFRSSLGRLDPSASYILAVRRLGTSNTSRGMCSIPRVWEVRERERS
jgi:hypothetical protein